MDGKKQNKHFKSIFPSHHSNCWACGYLHLTEKRGTAAKCGGNESNCQLDQEYQMTLIRSWFDLWLYSLISLPDGVQWPLLWNIRRCCQDQSKLMIRRYSKYDLLFQRHLWDVWPLLQSDISPITICLLQQMNTAWLRLNIVKIITPEHDKDLLLKTK